MRPARRTLHSIVLLFVLMALVFLPARTGLALSIPHPQPPRKLTVQGTLMGKLGKGAKVQFNVVATDPKGWTDLRSVKILMLLRGFSIQEVTLLVTDQAIGTTGVRPVKLGGPPLPGSFLRIVNGRTSRFVRQTFSIRLIFWARVTESIPGETKIRLVATNQQGISSRATNDAPVSPGLLSWGTLALAAAAALFVGGFFGNTVTHRRYRQRQASIWQIVERRLKEQKVRPPASPPAVRVSEGPG